MLVVLEGLQEVIVLCEWLVSACSRHIKSSVLHLLTPESNCLLSLITHISVDELLKLLVAADLPSFLEAKGLSEIIIYIVRRDCDSALVVHYKSADSILVQWFRGKSSFISGFI